MRLVFLLSFMLFSFRTFPQFRTCPGSVPFLAMTGYSAARQDAFSLMDNPAMPALHAQWEWGAFCESRYIPSGIRLAALSMSVSTPKGAPGIFGTMVNAAGYMDADAGFVYSIPVAAGMAVGAGGSIRLIQVAGHRSERSFHSSLGLLFQPSPVCRIGVCAKDPAGLQIRDPFGDSAPQYYSVGMGYDPSDMLCCCAELICEEGRKMQVAGLIQYAAGKKFYLRCGFLSSSGTFFSGAGFSFHHNLRLLLLVSYHQQLGPGSAMIIEGPLKNAGQ